MDVQEHDYEELAGDPDHLQTMAQHYLGIADKIRKSVSFLHSLSDGDDQKSKATDALKESAGKVADDIDKAENRYRVTAQALLDYVPAMRQAQQDAHTAVVHIRSAQHDVTTTGAALDKANDAVDGADDAGKDDAKTAQTKAKTAASDAASALSTWQGKWRDARDARDTAAHTARNQINDLIQHHNEGLKNPEHHWYDGVVSFVKSAWHAIEGPLKFICKWAGVLSIFLAWVPGLGEVLLGLAILGAAITLIEDISTGAGWKAILGDSIGLALTAFGGGLGKYLGKAAKFSRFSRMEKALKPLAGDRTNMLSGAEFRATFGVSKNQMIKAMARDELGRVKISDFDMADVAAFKASKFKSFVNEVKNPFASSGDGFSEALQGFKHNPLDLKLVDLGIKQNGLSVPRTIGLGLYDARTVVQTGSTLINTGNDLVHGDFGLSGDKNGQVPAIAPDDILVDKLTK